MYYLRLKLVFSKKPTKKTSLDIKNLNKATSKPIKLFLKHISKNEYLHIYLTKNTRFIKKNNI